MRARSELHGPQRRGRARLRRGHRRGLQPRRLPRSARQHALRVHLGPDGERHVPGRLHHGTEWLPAQLNANTATETDVNGHGTHVLGTIGGDGSQTGGSIPAFTFGHAGPPTRSWVKTDPHDDAHPRRRRAAFGKATALGKNCVVNLSLGSQFGPHDGTSAFESARPRSPAPAA